MILRKFFKKIIKSEAVLRTVQRPCILNIQCFKGLMRGVQRRHERSEYSDYTKILHTILHIFILFMYKLCILFVFHYKYLIYDFIKLDKSYKILYYFIYYIPSFPIKNI